MIFVHPENVDSKRAEISKSSVKKHRLAHWEHGIRLDILIARYLRVQVFVARWTNRGGALSFRQKQRFQLTDSSMPGDVTIRQEIVRRWIWFHQSPLLCWFKKWQIEKCHIWYPMVSPLFRKMGSLVSFIQKFSEHHPKCCCPCTNLRILAL